MLAAEACVRLETNIAAVHRREQLARGLRTISRIDGQHRFEQGKHRRGDVSMAQLFQGEIVTLSRP